MHEILLAAEQIRDELDGGFSRRHLEVRHSSGSGWDGEKERGETTLTSCCWRVLFRRAQKWLHPLHRMFSDVTTFSKIVSSLVVEGNELTHVCLHRDVSSVSDVVVD